ANPTALAERPGIKKDAIEREEQKPNRLEKKSISTTPTNSTPPTIVVRRPRSESLSMEAEPELRFTSSSLGRSKSINLRLDSSYETLYDGNPIEIEAGNNQNDGQESEEADSSSLYEPPPRMLGLEMGDFEYPAEDQSGSSTPTNSFQDFLPPEQLVAIQQEGAADLPPDLTTSEQVFGRSVHDPDEEADAL
uniref:MAST3 n=2 Tax=Macrostomum lignano TaxID=282301 RepID=A0A1I8GXB1_9PLAT